MIRVKKIAHATYETPDLDQQIEYYTDILGLTLAAKETDVAYLASTLDHHSVELRRGGHSQCTRLGFQIGLAALLRRRQIAAASQGGESFVFLPEPEERVAEEELGLGVLRVGLLSLLGVDQGLLVSPNL